MTEINYIRKKHSVVSIILLGNITVLLYFYVLNEKRDFVDKTTFYQQSLEIMYKRQSQNLPAGTVLFFGDSQIQGLSVIAITPKSVNFGIGHQQLQDLAFHIHEYSGLEQAAKIVIGIGINDLLKAPQLNKEMSIERLTKALQTYKNKVIILSVLPVNETKLFRPKLNQQILAFNQQLQFACQKNGFKFIDVYSEFTDENGLLKKNYDLGDGLHLNQAGYEVLIQRLKLDFNEGKTYES